MKRFQFVIAVSIMLLGVFGFATGSNLPPDEGGTSLGGLVNVDLVDIDWMEGDWVHVFDHSQEISIVRSELGIYTSASNGPMNNNTITIINTGCERIAEFHMGGAGQQLVMYARVSGFSERVSFDMLPAMFPMAWSDKGLLESMGIVDQDEVPAHRRMEALGLLSKTIDEKGTFMRQDLTFYRPHAFEMLDDEMMDD